MPGSCNANLGFRIVGNCAGERRTVNWLAAFTGYAECGPLAQVDSEAYLSAFTFAPEFAEHMAANRTTKGYAGRCAAPWLWFDIDAAGDLERAATDARRLCAGMVDRYAIDGDVLLAFFSGSKGFHVGLPLVLAADSPDTAGPPATQEFHQVAKRFACAMAERLAVNIDAGVYDRVRAFRAPNSRHPGTGLFKRRLAFDELLGLRLDAITRLAESPEPFDVPAIAPGSIAHNGQAVADWRDAVAAVGQQSTAMADRRTNAGGGGATLNRQTLEFIRDGASIGDRHRLLFSAAANLAEFGCPAPLAHALLTESALDCGLTPSDVRRQIECGLDAAGSAQ